MSIVEERALLAQEDVLLALEVGEDRPRRDVRRLGDLRERRLVVAALGEQPQRHPGDLLARLLLLALAQPELRGGVSSELISSAEFISKLSQKEILQ